MQQVQPGTKEPPDGAGPTAGNSGRGAAALEKPSGYPKYEEIAFFLRRCTELHPELCRVYPAGRSYEGRDILCCELTASETGPAGDKPAYYIDANHHAGEVTGSATALYTIWYLLSRYGADETTTTLLDEQALYVIPRVAVDGSEIYLTTPEMLRSSARLYPEVEEKEGLYPEDIDGDGHILTMRVPDLNGSWRVSAADDRLMVRRRPGETGGKYYRLYVEGLIRDYDGVQVRPAPPKRGLDFNRNYPGTWAPESVQRGAGPYPGSEPEVRTVIEFMHSHPNIVGAMSYHTSGGMILRPHCAKADEKLPPADLLAMKALAEIGGRLTGYPTWSIYEEFTLDKDRPPVGSWMDWAYELNGVLPLAIELWDMFGQAGVKKLKPRETRTLSTSEVEDRLLAALRWNDRVLAGKGFVRWRPFRHPQLGPVEIGGWLPKTVRQNPPRELLEGECHKCAVFTVAHAVMAPKLDVASFSAEELGPAAGGGPERLYKLTAVVENRGYLPTNVTQQALVSRVAKEVQVVVSGPGVKFLTGSPKTRIGHIPGYGVAGGVFGGSGSPETRKKVEWLVAAEPGTAVLLEAHGPKCGRRRARLTL